MDYKTHVGRRPIPEHKRRKPSDYPQLAFRLSEADKKELLRLADVAANEINRSRGDRGPYCTKGDAFVQALYIGLKRIRAGKKE